MARRIEIWPTDRLVPYAKNARTHSAEQVAQIAASILEHRHGQVASVRRGPGRRELEQAYEEARAGEVAGRFGTIEEFGAACAFLCGDKAGYITGQNLLLDGGYYHGTL